MKKIIMGRRKGKTTELIKMSAATQTYILVKDGRRQREVARMAQDMGLHIPYPVTMADWERTHFVGSFIKEILIDDADDIIQSIFYRMRIKAITMSEDREAEDEQS